MADGGDPCSDIGTTLECIRRLGLGGVTLMKILSGVEDPPERGEAELNCIGTTPPEVVGTEEQLDDEVGLGLLLGSLSLAVSSLSCPLSPLDHLRAPTHEARNQHQHGNLVSPGCTVAHTPSFEQPHQKKENSPSST